MYLVGSHRNPLHNPGQQRKTAQADAVWQQTVDWAEAELPWSQQEHLARPAAALALATTDRQRSQLLAGRATGDDGGGWQEYLVERILFREQMKKMIDESFRKTQ